LKIEKICLAVLIVLYACHPAAQQKLSADELNDSVIRMTANYTRPATYPEALRLMNEAIRIDSNNFLSHRNKLFFQESLKQFDSAIITLDKLIRLRPDSADLYFQAGFYHELYGDSLKAKPYFLHALPLYKAMMLDAAPKTNEGRSNTYALFGETLIMLGHEKEVRAFLKQQCKTRLDSIFMSAKELSRSKEETIAQARAQLGLKFK